MRYNFEKLEIWQLGMKIVQKTYAITRKFPKEELFGLTSQMRRAAVSIPINIAEGSAKQSRKEVAVFLRTAIASALELITASRIAEQEKFAVPSEFRELNDLLQEEYFKIIAFEKKLR